MLELFVSGLAGAILGSFLTMWAQARENRRAAALQVMQVVEQKLSVLRGKDLKTARTEVLEYYGSSGGSLSVDACAYLDYVSTLDFYLYAAQAKLLDGGAATPWLRDLVKNDDDTRTFVKKLRATRGEAFADLEHLHAALSK